jgi:glyoxylase-like metal-dependent hydrolase (beta-lactamase superfamily II)
MRVRKPGKIREKLWFLGCEESGVYLLEGRDGSMLVSGGMSYIVPELLLQFKEFSIDENRIRKLLILHAHFDHVGVVPFFKRRHPAMEVYASERGWEILRMEKAIRTINEFSVSVAAKMGKTEVCSKYDLEWRHDVTGQTVHEGDRIDLGDIEVRVFEIPGHSSCSIGAYVPQFKALFPSDGGGIPYKDTIIPSGNSNYTQFQEGLERLKNLDVEYLCADHYGYVTGEEAKEFISNTIEMAKTQRALIEKTYNHSRDVDQTVKELIALFASKNPDYFLSREIMEGVYGQMVRHIAKVREPRKQ